MEKSEESIKCIETPEMTVMKNSIVDERWRENDKKTEKENIDSLLKIDSTGRADEKDEEEERTQEEKKCVSEFEEEKEKGAFLEQPEGIFDDEACNNKGEKSHHKKWQSNFSILEASYKTGKKVFHTLL